MVPCSNCHHQLNSGDRFCPRCGTPVSGHVPREALAFISYSRKDTEFTARLRGDLGNRGFQVWIDHEKLTPGTPDWEQAVRNGIEKAQVLVFVASPESRKSPYVRDELDLAKMHDCPVLPIWATGDAWLDCVPLGWGRTQYIDARGDKYTAGMEQLSEALASIRAYDESVSAGTVVIGVGARYPRVFLSYAHQDAADARKLAADLRAAGVEVSMLDDAPASEFVQEINRGLSGSEWLVQVLTPAAVRSIWVRREVDAALNLVWRQEMNGVVPVVTRPVANADMPALWRTLQRVDATQDYSAAVQALLKILSLRQP
jgi:hypothetical protein